MSKTLNGVPFRQIWLPEEKYSIKAPFAMVWKKLTLHETDNMMDALREIRYMISNTNQTSYHIAADENEIIQAIPFNRNAWHSGDGLNGYGNRNTIGWEMCRNYDRNRQTTQLLEPLSSQYKRTVQNTIKGAAQLFVNEGRIANNDNIKTHFDWSGKHCPRKARNDGQVLIIKAGIINEYNRLKGIKTKPVTPSSKVKVDGHLTKAQVIDKTIAGGYGSQPHRQNNIVSRTIFTYEEIQNGVNAKLTGGTQTTKTLSFTEVVNATIDGKYGSGKERERRIPAETKFTYRQVQDEVNAVLLGKAPAKPKPAPAKPKYDAEKVAQDIAKGVGGWGNGDKRVANLKKAGLNPTTVQNRVNQILKDKSAKPKPAPAKPKYDAEKVAQDIAKGVGGWETGQKRIDHLKKAGLNPDQVQKRVNEIINGTKVSKSEPVWSTEKVAQDIAKGKGGWGNGATRVKKLEEAGLNPTTVQNRVNAILKGQSKYTTESVAQEIAKGTGGWGNGTIRMDNIRKVGLNPITVQKRVNEILRSK